MFDTIEFRVLSFHLCPRTKVYPLHRAVIERHPFSAQTKPFFSVLIISELRKKYWGWSYPSQATYKEFEGSFYWLNSRGKRILFWRIRVHVHYCSIYKNPKLHIFARIIENNKFRTPTTQRQYFFLLLQKQKQNI